MTASLTNLNTVLIYRDIVHRISTNRGTYSQDLISVQNMLAMLQQQYPQGLMPELAQHTQGCLQDMLDAFPNAENVSSSHLVSLVSGVESLLRISDYQRRRVLHHMKRSQSEAE